MELPQRARNAMGFTLIELAIVLVVIAILTAMIIPEMRGTMEGETLRSTARELVRGLRLAHSQSITLHQRHRLLIDRKNNRYRVERFARSQDAGSGYVPVRDVPGAQAALSDKIDIQLKATDEAASISPDATSEQDPLSSEARDLAVSFLPDGTAEAVEIVLRDRDGFGLALRVSPVTARVQVVELEKRGGS